MTKKENLINLDDYNESMINCFTTEGIVGSVYDCGKYIQFWLTSVSVHGNIKRRHTFRCMIWKSKFKSFPGLKHGDHIIAKGEDRMRLINAGTVDEIRIAEKVVTEVIFK